MELPKWTKYPVATCSEIVEFLSDKCYDKPLAWIPFTFANRSRKDTLQYVQCRQRRRLEHFCEHDRDVLRPLLLFDTRACTK